MDLNLKPMFKKLLRKILQTEILTVKRDTYKIRTALRSHHILYSFIGGVGIVMFWYGIWEGLKRIPFLGHPLVALIIGFTILLVSGLIVFGLIGSKVLDEKLEDVEEATDDIAETAENIQETVEKTQGQVEETQNIVETKSSKETPPALQEAEE